MRAQVTRTDVRDALSLLGFTPSDVQSFHGEPDYFEITSYVRDEMNNAHMATRTDTYYFHNEVIHDG